VTDRRRLAGPAAVERTARDCVVRQAKFAVDAGIDVIQIRERDLEAAALSELVTAIVMLSRGTRTRVVVNDRLDVALACGAAGVHLPADSLRPAAVRTLAPSGFLIGRSVHGVQEAGEAGREADYLIAGTVWPTESKAVDAPLLGLSGLTAIVRVSAVPVLAIGGVTTERADMVKATGAAGIAGIGLFMGPAHNDGCRAIDLHAAAEDTRARFDTSGAPS
jgi:thiamine-phosphate diphosphorylase